MLQVLKMMVGNNLKDNQLQQIVDKTILFHDKDGDGKISFNEFCDVSVCLGEVRSTFSFISEKIWSWRFLRFFFSGICCKVSQLCK